MRHPLPASGGQPTLRNAEDLDMGGQDDTGGTPSGSQNPVDDQRRGEANLGGQPQDNLWWPATDYRDPLIEACADECQKDLDQWR